MWDARKIQDLDSWGWCFSFFPIIKGSQIDGVSCLWPAAASQKDRLVGWIELVKGHMGWCLVFLVGDWNVIRFPSEKSRGGGGWLLSQLKCLNFLYWIESHSLIDLQMGGATLTWSNHRDHLILTRLDRFLVSTVWINYYSKVQQLALLRVAFDHCPILLDSCCERWGPAPFRFERMWLEEPHFFDLIGNWWKEIRVDGCVGFRLAIQLKMLKSNIRSGLGLNLVTSLWIKRIFYRRFSSWIRKKRVSWRKEKSSQGSH